jgi:dihydroorotase
MLDLVVEGNAFLDGKLIKCCIGIDEGKIVAIKKILKGDRHLDFGDKLIMPAGLDIHTHFREPGFTYKENFETGTQAAAFGGISYSMDMPNTKPPVIDAASVKEKLEIIDRKACIDFGLYSSIFSRKEVQRTSQICSAFKIYLGSTTGKLLFDNNRILPSLIADINSNNRIPTFHAESENIIQQKLKTRKSPKNLHDHLLDRPNVAEVKAITRLLNIGNRMINKILNTNTNRTLGIMGRSELFNEKFEINTKTNQNYQNPIFKIHICHVSTNEGIKKIRNFRRKLKVLNLSDKIKVSCEVTPHHLLLNEKFQGGSFGKVNPPLRQQKDQNALWEAVFDGTVNILASDHAPHTVDEKTQEFSSAPSGLPGVETMLPLMLSQVKHNHLKLNDLIKIISINPAKLYGLPKGRLAVGMDADLVVIDFYSEKAIRSKYMHSKCGWTPYEKFDGIFPILTVVRGNIIIREDNFESDPGFGNFYN